jgi:hypothetical protein
VSKASACRTSRSRNLVLIDNGIIMARHRLLRSIKALRDKGVVAPGADPAHQEATVRCCHPAARPGFLRCREGSSGGAVLRRRRYDLKGGSRTMEDGWSVTGVTTDTIRRASRSASIDDEKSQLRVNFGSSGWPVKYPKNRGPESNLCHDDDLRRSARHLLRLLPPYFFKHRTIRRSGSEVRRSK